MSVSQLQQPLIVYPANNETVDATSSTVVFYLDIRGVQCTKYHLYIYDVATNTLHIDSGVVTLGSTLYDGDRLNITVNISSIGADSYYWKIDLYWNPTNFITSAYYTFNASTPPSISFTPIVPSTITTPSYEFINSYSQAEGVMVKYWEIKLYDSTVIQTDIDNGTAKYLLTSGQTWTNNIRYTFNGLISTYSYKVQTTGLTQQNIAFATPLTSFNVSYTVPAALTHPSATMRSDTSILVDWGNISAITGTTSGTVSYEPNFLSSGNVALNMAAGAYVQFTLDFNAPFTKVWLDKRPAGFTGDMGEIKNTAGTNYVRLGYDGTRFYMNINGDYYYDAAETLTTNPYILGIISDGISIRIRHREVA
jgi:hypothetical protein